MSDEIARLNAAVWTRKNSEYGDAWADEAWASQDIHWGLFQLPESELHVLGDVAGLDAIELGCGTGYFSSWLARRGARVVGIDVTPAQLATARRCQEKFGLNFPLIEANAEHVPLPAGSFDLALSEYGACLWCEPELWVEEAARLLRPGGRLVFLTNSVVLALCIPERGVAGAALLRGQREIGGSLGRTTVWSSTWRTARGSTSWPDTASPWNASPSCMHRTRRRSSLGTTF
jgi:SAM-dependent methyltransferase